LVNAFVRQEDTFIQHLAAPSLPKQLLQFGDQSHQFLFGTLMPVSTSIFNIMTFHFCCQAATLAV
jgi:hypothetical protein